jgi:hypothetical protein
MSTDSSELNQQALQELEIEPPRDIQLRPSDECKFAWRRIHISSILCMLFILLLFYICLVPILAERYGQAATATIQKLWISTGGRSGTVYHLRFDYSDGQSMIETETGTSPEIYNRLYVGQKIQIHFLPVFPDRISLDFDSSSGKVAFWFFFIVVFIFIGNGSYAVIKKRYLISHGKALKCRVTYIGSKVMKAKFEINKKEYSVKAPVTPLCKGHEMGDEIVVLFDPKHPGFNMVYDPSDCIWMPTRDLIL